MSGSKHTSPPQIRAARRVWAPYAPRGQGERREHILARLLKEHGMVAETIATGETAEGHMRWPRLYAQRPRAGHTFAITLGDVQRVLSFFRAHSFYGVQAIELVQGEETGTNGPLRLGRLLVPGRIVLYDHPPSPWALAGRIAPRERQRLRQGGALIEPAGLGHHTVISWPGTTLRDFMLFDVLMHEVGHHLVQQYTGKYSARVMRTRDHEMIAGRFAAIAAASTARKRARHDGTAAYRPRRRRH